MVVVFLIVISWLGAGIGLMGWLLYHPVPTIPDYFDPSLIEYSREYQITINQPDWTNRSAMIEIWLEKVNEFLPELGFTMKDQVSTWYSQSQFTATGSERCKASHKMRLRTRNYTDGDRGGGSSVDLKQSGYDWESCPLPFWPASKYLSDSVQKCEQDIHPCFSKHSRVSKIYFDSFRGISTCKDLVDLYPDAFQRLTNVEYKHKLSVRNYHCISLTEFSKTIGNTRVKLAFDIKYSSENGAKFGDVQPATGEFSIKISTEENREGFYQSVWNEELRARIHEAYFRLVLLFDKFEDHIHCANEYLNQMTS